MFIQYSYLAHMNFFKMVFLDVAFFSTRTIFHGVRLANLKFWAFVTMIFVTYDFC